MSATAWVAHSELTVHIDNLIEALRSPRTRLETARQWGRRLAVPLLAFACWAAPRARPGRSDPGGVAR